MDITHGAGGEARDVAAVPYPINHGLLIHEDLVRRRVSGFLFRFALPLNAAARAKHFVHGDFVPKPLGHDPPAAADQQYEQEEGEQCFQTAAAPRESRIRPSSRKSRPARKLGKLKLLEAGGRLAK